MFKKDKEKIEEVFEQFYKEAKNNVKMSLGVFLNTNNTYYLIADTRSIIEEKGIPVTNNDCVHKIVKLKKIPMAILNMGFNEFTKNHISFEEYVYEYLEPYINEIKQKEGFFNTNKIIRKMVENLEESVLQYEKENKIPYDLKEYCNVHANEIIILLYDQGAKMNILFKYIIRPIFGVSIRPESIESSYIICGHKQADEIMTNILSNNNIDNNKVIDFANKSFKEVYNKLPPNQKVINDKVDILKIQDDKFEWLQRQ